MAGRRKKTRWFVTAAVLALVTGMGFFLWSVKREIPFDPERWKNPSWATDRSRMLRDLDAVLEARQWTRDELLPMLEGGPERQNPFRAAELTRPPGTDSLGYVIADPSPWWPLVRTADTAELHLFFRPDGRFHGWEMRGDSD